MVVVDIVEAEVEVDMAEEEEVVVEGEEDRITQKILRCVKQRNLDEKHP